MTIDRRLRSGDAPSGALLAIWLLTSLCIVFAAMAWPVPSTGGLAARILPLLVGCVALAVAMLGLGRTAWRLLGREACIASCLLLPLNPLVLEVFLPQGGQHAAWQLAATACAVWSLSHRDATLGAMLAGCAMAVGCAIDPAIWPVAAALGTMLFVRWLGDRQHMGAEFVGFLKGFVVVSLALLAAKEIFVGNGACVSARLAPFAALAILLAGTMGLARIPRATPALVVGGTAAIVAASLAAATLMPGCSGRAFPLSVFPIGLPQMEMLAAALLPAVVALGASVYLWRSNDAWLRRWWREYTCVLAATAMAGIVMPNLLPVAAMLAVMPLGWLAAQMLFGHQHAKRRMWRPACVGVIALAASVIASAAQLAPERAGAGVPSVLAASTPR